MLFALLTSLSPLQSFTNLRISHSGPSVRIKSQCGRRGYVKNILYENITAEDVAEAVWIDMQYGQKDPSTTCPASEVSAFTNITVRNLHAKSISKGGSAYMIVGLSVSAAKAPPITGLTLENITVAGKYTGKDVCRFADVKATGMVPPLPSCKSDDF